MKTTFSHTEVFPLIADLITGAAADDAGFVEHDTIVKALLAAPEGASLVARASKDSSLPDEHSVAANMVAWFSQQITIGRSPWADFFDRERRGGTWAYRPKTALQAPIAPDSELSAVEGDSRFFFHLRRERDSRLAAANERR